MILPLILLCAVFLPAFADSVPKWNLTPKEILEEAKSLVSAETTFQKGIAAIKEPTVENVLIPTINFENENEWKKTSLAFYKYVSPSKDVRDASARAEQIVGNTDVDEASRNDLSQVYRKLWEQIKDDSSATDPESFRFLHSIIQSSKQNGGGLSAARQTKVYNLQDHLSNLSSNFAQNIDEDNAYVTFTKEQLDGVPARAMQQYEQLDKNGVVSFKVPSKYAESSPVLKHCRNQDTRKAAYLALMNKVPQNAAVLADIVRTRFHIAKLLGYASYSELALEDEMAKSPENVMAFLADLREMVLPLAKSELATMIALKNRDLAARGLTLQDVFYAWDDAYYTNMLLEREYHVDSLKLSEYFPLENTLNKTFSRFESLFDIKFVHDVHPDPDTIWHEDVRKYAVYQNIEYGEPKSQFMGWVLFDLHPREGKFSHAATFRLHTAYVKPDGSTSPGVTAVVCNFTKPTKRTPSLLKHSEILTFFHELGHALHHLLSQSRDVRFQVSHIPKDFVECPSQVMEYWAWSKDELKRLSGHYITGESIPDELLENLVRSKHVNRGLAISAQLFYSLFDMELHRIDTQEELDKLDLSTVWNSLFEDITFETNGGIETSGYTTFGHFVWGYASVYYGYLYSKVFATDIYSSHFRGDPTNLQKGLRYRDVILASGRSREISDVLEELLGRKANSDAYLHEILG